jgi:amino acid transporter
MTKRLALMLFALAIALIAVAYGSAFLPGPPPPWAAWLLAAGTCLSLVSMMAVGAARNGRIDGRLTAAFGLVLLLVGGGFGALLALPPASPGDPSLWLGLPPRAAVLLYGIGVLPFFIVPVAYAWTFDAFTLSEADLDRVRSAAKGWKAEAAAGEPDGRARSAAAGGAADEVSGGAGVGAVEGSAS